MENEKKVTPEEKRAKAKARREAYNAEDHLFKFFTVRDLVFVAVCSAAMLVTCAVMPLVAGLQLFGINFLAVSFQISLFQAVIIGKVQKFGASFISMLLLGLLHLAFAIQMFPICIIAGALSELLAMLIFRRYKNRWSVGITAALPPLFIAGMNTGWTYVVSGEEATRELFLSGVGWYIPLAVCLGILVLAMLGSLTGTLTIFKLKEKGVIKDGR